MHVCHAYKCKCPIQALKANHEVPTIGLLVQNTGFSQATSLIVLCPLHYYEYDQRLCMMWTRMIIIYLWTQHATTHFGSEYVESGHLISTTQTTWIQVSDRLTQPIVLRLSVTLRSYECDQRQCNILLVTYKCVWLYKKYCIICPLYYYESKAVYGTQER